MIKKKFKFRIFIIKNQGLKPLNGETPTFVLESEKDNLFEGLRKDEYQKSLQILSKTECINVNLSLDGIESNIISGKSKNNLKMLSTDFWILNNHFTTILTSFDAALAIFLAKFSDEKETVFVFERIAV